MIRPLNQVLDGWRRAFSEEERTEWEQRLRIAIHAAQTGADAQQRLSSENSWTLLGWCEESVSFAVQGRDVEKLFAATEGLIVLLAQGVVDDRELLLVGSLVRRAAFLVGLDWSRFRTRFRGSKDGGVLLDKFPERVSPKSHREVGTGSEFRFERVPLSSWSEGELLRRLSGR